MRPQVGQVINNKYRLLRLIGDGGMGSVYEARHEVLGTSVALKFLHAELTKRPGLVQRFLQEARVSAQIASPHVVRVTDVDQTPGGAFIVMEYIEGKTLQTLYEDLYKAGQQLSYADALEYAMQMLEGVEAAHKSGIVHRDLKPDNVMIATDAKGRSLLKLLDFGIAKLKVAEDYDRKLTRPGVIMGTPEYMAPEQAYSADAVDARADIFSLGVMIFEMLAGRRPVGGEDAHQIATAYLTGQIARLGDLAPEIAPALAEAVHAAMAPLPGDRTPTVTAFRDAIEPFAVAVRAPSALPPTPSMVMAAIAPPAGSPVMKSSPGIPRATPETNAGPLSGQLPIPKTLPPDDEAAAPAAPSGAFAAVSPEVPASADAAGAERAPARRQNATLAADPPSMSNPPSRDPTPLGGFAAVGADGVPIAVSPSGSFAVGAHDGGDLGRTPMSMRVDRGATVMASPLPGYDVAPLPPSPARITGVPTPAYVPPAAVPKVTPRSKPRSPLSSLPAILLLAAGVSAAVVGGIYLAHSNANVDDHDDSPPPPPAATVQSDPPDEPPPSAEPAPPAAPTHPSWRPSGPPLKQPPPKGSAAPGTPQPPPSGTAPPPGGITPPAPGTTPSRVPVIPSVLVIPSSFPFGFPFGPPPSGPPPGGESPRNAPQDGPPRDRPQRSNRPTSDFAVPARRPPPPSRPPQDWE